MEKDILLELKNITKNYGENSVVSNLNLKVRRNEFVTLLGPSGCGKTTTLNIIAGFKATDDGSVIFENKDISNIPPNKRQINTVFQKYALFTHMNVFENIAFGLRIKKLPENTIKEKVHAMLKLVELSGFEKRSINSLSGGQQQRIAIARALVNEPKLLLLDEPLGALDQKLRKEMQVELKRMQQHLGITFIFVTHDQEEALTMSDTIVVLNKGIVQQIGSPEEIYNEPNNKFVADFIGESNIIEGTILKDNKIKFDNHVFKCEENNFNKNENVDVVIRPEDIQITECSTSSITGKVISSVFRGVYYEIIVETENNTRWTIHNTAQTDINKNICLSISEKNIHIMRKDWDDK
ncbi:MAG: ABC transporter ATP-binding protein [Clostridium sp.]|nr:ABC transporter ATP-binding protein [Clostridium sp.]